MSSERIIAIIVIMFLLLNFLKDKIIFFQILIIDNIRSQKITALSQNKPANIFKGEEDCMEKLWLRHYDEGVPENVESPDVTLFEMFQETAKKCQENTFVKFMGLSLTYQETADLIDKFAASLANLGVKKGGKVAIHLPNCPQFIIAYFATLKLGAIIVPCNPLYVAREMKYQLNDSGAETIITLTRFYGMIKGLKKETKIKNIIVTNIKDYFPGKLKLLYTLLKEKKEGDRVTLKKEDYNFSSLLKEGNPADLLASSNTPDDSALYLYTGGTTGRSKGAVLANRNLVVNAHQLKHWLGKVKFGESKFLIVLPLFHSFGMTLGMNSALAVGGQVVLLPRFDAKTVLKTIQKEKIQYFPGVPTIYVALNNTPGVEKYDLTSLKICMSGGAPLPKEVQEQFEKMSGAKVTEGYGLSETSPVTHVNPINGFRKVGSVGLPMPSTVMKVTDVDTGEDLPLGEVGELCVKGPQVMKGYLNMPEETKSVLKDGWFKTGDIARIDEDGFTFLVDRKKDMIIAGGFNIYPRDVEEVLFTHPAVQEAVVAGIRDPYRGETIKAYIVLKEGASVTEKEIVKYCKENLAIYKVPKQVEFRKELPKTMIGKVLRRVLREEEEKKLQMSKAASQ